MSKDVVLGVDIGTSSIKYSLITPSGECVLSHAGEYPLVKPGPGLFEIDPDDLWQRIAGSIRAVVEQGAGDYRIEAVCACAMMIMPVFLDAKRRVVRPVIHWQDERLLAQCEKLKAQGKDKLIAGCSGSLLTGESTLNAIEWVRDHEPGNFARISTFIMIKDYIRYRFTGVVCSDYGDASGSLMLDVAHRRWSADTARALGLPASIFPELRSSDSAGGTLTREASQLTGLPEGLPVVVGTGDGICTILGLGVIESGDVGITVGSAGVIGVATEKPPIDAGHRNYVFCHPAADRWYSIMATAASGDVLRWYRDELIRNAGLGYKEIDEEARPVPPGADGLLFLPYILGSRNPHSNPGACGIFLGLRRRHGRSHLTRAVLEGILLEILDLYLTGQEVCEKLGVGLKSVKVSGGIVKSDLWLHMLADVLGKQMVQTEQDELGALGCGILAYKGIGYYSSLRDSVKNMVREKRVVPFDESANVAYRKKFDSFRRAYRQMETLALPPDA